MVAAVLIGFYLLCCVVGFGIFAYRDPGGDASGEVAGLLLAAPVGLGYQCGALVRETRQGSKRRY